MPGLDMTMPSTTSLAAFIQQGPPRGDVCKGLEQLRSTVLVEGIPSSNDGMVS